MSNIRQIVDGEVLSPLGIERPKAEVAASSYSVKDQVVVRERASRSGPTTNEMKVGTVMAVGDKTITVSFPGVGGKFTKKTVPLEAVSPVTEVYRRNHVHVNPVFRQIYKGV